MDVAPIFLAVVLMLLLGGSAHPVKDPKDDKDKNANLNPLDTNGNKVPQQGGNKPEDKVRISGHPLGVDINNNNKKNDKVSNDNQNVDKEGRPLGVNDNKNDKDNNNKDNKKDKNATPYKSKIGKVIWTADKDVVAGGGNSNKKKSSSEGGGGAFRDLVIEKTGEKIFASFMDKVHHPEFVGYKILRDPMYLREGLKVKKKSSMFDINLSADHLAVHGLHGLRLTYMRVIRHLGLRDIKVNARIGADIKIDGKYKLDGQAMGFIPVTGDGGFVIDVKSFSLSAISFLVLNEEKGDKKGSNSKNESLVIRELEVTIDHEEVKFEFENLMGGGVVGSAANLVINAMGEAIIDSQRQQIVTLLKTRFKEEITRFL